MGEAAAIGEGFASSRAGCGRAWCSISCWSCRICPRGRSLWWSAFHVKN